MTKYTYFQQLKTTGGYSSDKLYGLTNLLMQPPYLGVYGQGIRQRELCGYLPVTEFLRVLYLNQAGMLQAAAMCDTYYTGLRINCKDSRITAVIWSPFLHGLNNATVPVQKYSGYR